MTPEVSHIQVTNRHTSSSVKNKVDTKCKVISAPHVKCKYKRKVICIKGKLKVWAQWCVEILLAKKLDICT